MARLVFPDQLMNTLKATVSLHLLNDKVTD